MHFSKDLVNVRSRRLWPAILTAAACCVGSSLVAGCIIIDEDDDGHHHGRGPDVIDEPETNQPPAKEIMMFPIDTDKILDSPPGEGVGLFVEYATGGTWRLWTTCDTNYSNVGCKFDVAASVDAASKIDVVEGSDLEGYDEVNALDDGSVTFHAETASDIDVMTLFTTPGSVLRVELLVDGSDAGRFIYWVGEGILHKGAPTNPIDLQPTTP
ncbi:MAG TPA: hypothetical protein VE093_13315 [Polyangiaceae bacterium]|nr:hypothetical protein [Polyangiaceae bacterium]